MRFLIFSCRAGNVWETMLRQSNNLQLAKYAKYSRAIPVPAGEVNVNKLNGNKMATTMDVAQNKRRIQ